MTMKNTIIRLRAGLLSASLLALPAISHANPAAQWQPKEFPIGFWLGPPQAANTVESYRRVKDCGFTLAFVGFGNCTTEDYRKTLDICQDIGLKAMVYMHEEIWREYARKTDWRAIPAKRAEEFGQHPALAGWGLLDEPRAEHFADLAAWNRTLGERTPGKLRFINLLPHGCPPEQTGAKSYEDYVETFLSTVKPDVLCFDHYVLVKEGVLEKGTLVPNYFENLEIIRAAALRHGVPAWNGILAWSHLVYASPTPEQMRWQVWTSLAYGMKGIMYFTYWPDPEQKPGMPAIVDVNGKPSAIYPEVKKLNHEMQTLGQTLLKLTSTGVYHAGEIPSGGKPVPADAALQLPADQPLMVGFFRKDGTDEDYAIVVNRDYAKPVEFDLRPGAAVRDVRLVSAENGAISALPVADGKLRLALSPGEGKLLKLIR
jgi:hypothetical protein